MATVVTDVVDQVVTKTDGQIQVRAIRTTTVDGVVTSTVLHRHVVHPGDDYSGEDAAVQSACASAHTSGVVSAYQTAVANMIAGDG
tara:strand:- start:122 stop:379 length:258 start_codon:yes stop_codon:yes gene_type:complete